MIELAFMIGVAGWARAKLNPLNNHRVARSLGGLRLSARRHPEAKS